MELVFGVASSSIKAEVTAIFETDSAFQEKIVEILEKWFFDAAKSTGITYEDFQVVLLQIDEIQLVEEGVTNDPRIKRNGNSQSRRRLQTGGDETVEISLVFEVWCAEETYGTFQGAARTNHFQEKVKTNLREEIAERIPGGLTEKGDSLTLESEGYTPLFETQTFWEQIKNDSFLLINIIYIFSAAFICLLAYIHSKTDKSCGKVHAVDQIRPKYLLTFFLLSAAFFCASRFPFARIYIGKYGM